MAVRITNGPVAVSMCRFTRSHASVARPRAGAGSPNAAVVTLVCDRRAGPARGTRSPSAAAISRRSWMIAFTTRVPQWDFLFRAARPRRRARPGGGASLQERRGRALLRGAK